MRGGPGRRSENALWALSVGIRALFAVLVTTACHGPGSDETGVGTTPGITSVSASEGATGTGGGGTTGGASNGSAATTSVMIDDLGAPDLLDMGAPAKGCGGKIDLLFVVSRDGGMKWVQARLLNGFPRFIDMIEAKYPGADYHVMVVDGGPHWGIPLCTEDCPKPFDSCQVYDYPCDQLDQVTGCDAIFGAGSVFPAGAGAANLPCGVANEQRFTTRKQLDPDKTFACMAKVGTSGNSWIGQALTAAVSHQLVGPGGCNDKFLRDDAVLVVVMLSSAYDAAGTDDGSAGTPEEWAKAVTAAKHGDEKAVVMVNILDGECPWWDRTCALAKLFSYHYVADKDDLDYGVAFEQASGLAQLACEGFVAPE